MPDQNQSVALSDGAAMPLIGFGTWNLRGRRGYEAIRYALDAGYRHLDTATMYGNEAEVGRALRDSRLDRREVFVTTKLPPGNTGREEQTIAASLRGLDTDYVDLWLVHWPPGRQAVLPTWREFVSIRGRGLARSIGVSNYSTQQLDQLVDATGEMPVVNQVPWGPSRHDPWLLDQHRQRGVVLEGYSPLKNTDLRNRVLAQIAATHVRSPAQIVLRWHLQHGIPTIPKSATPERIRSNLDVFGFSLDLDEMDRIDAFGSRRRFG
jgi:diketogulonate reductase-like aldo/keto reductase